MKSILFFLVLFSYLFPITRIHLQILNHPLYPRIQRPQLLIKRQHHLVYEV